MGQNGNFYLYLDIFIVGQKQAIPKGDCRITTVLEARTKSNKKEDKVDNPGG